MSKYRIVKERTKRVMPVEDNWDFETMDGKYIIHEDITYWALKKKLFGWKKIGFSDTYEGARDYIRVDIGLLERDEKIIAEFDTGEY